MDGSPSIAIKIAKEYQNKFNDKTDKNKPYFRIKCIFIDKNKSHCKSLENLLNQYKGQVDFEIIPGDFNNIISNVVRDIGNKPALFFVDPYGIKTVKKESVLAIVKKTGAKDIIFNYINEGVVRVTGVAEKCKKKSVEDITSKEIKTMECFYNFIGNDCAKLIGESDEKILKYYVESVLKSNNDNQNPRDNLEVIAFNMPYPHKRDTIYFLLFASRNKNAIKIVSQVYAKWKKVNLQGNQGSLFDKTNDQLLIHDNFKV